MTCKPFNLDLSFINCFKIRPTRAKSDLQKAGSNENQVSARPVEARSPSPGVAMMPMRRAKASQPRPESMGARNAPLPPLSRLASSDPIIATSPLNKTSEEATSSRTAGSSSVPSGAAMQLQSSRAHIASAKTVEIDSPGLLDVSMADVDEVLLRSDHDDSTLMEKSRLENAPRIMSPKEMLAHLAANEHDSRNLTCADVLATFAYKIPKSLASAREKFDLMQLPKEWIELLNRLPAKIMLETGKRFPKFLMEQFRKFDNAWEGVELLNLIAIHFIDNEEDTDFPRRNTFFQLVISGINEDFFQLFLKLPSQKEIFANSKEYYHFSAARVFLKSLVELSRTQYKRNDYQQCSMLQKDFLHAGSWHVKRSYLLHADLEESKSAVRPVDSTLHDWIDEGGPDESKSRLALIDRLMEYMYSFPKNNPDDNVLDLSGLQLTELPRLVNLVSILGLQADHVDAGTIWKYIPRFPLGTSPEDEQAVRLRLKNPARYVDLRGNHLSRDRLPEWVDQAYKNCQIIFDNGLFDNNLQGYKELIRQQSHPGHWIDGLQSIGRPGRPS